ncbi:MAG: NAD(P)-dependent glycerol-3-phosphate dehydrogenase [Chloroflexota bacterium]|nr:NAD(P)-dependent glycerol-3-phosphate dehydrogenase [Chloroflexota bacterium]
MTSAEQHGPVAVVGTTSWGGTLALILARRGIDVRLLARTDDEARRLASDGELTRRLPGHPFPPSLRVTADWTAGMDGASLMLFAVPSSTLRDNARRAAPHVPPDAIVVSACKGLEQGTFKRMSVVLAEELAVADLCALSGPNLAREVVRGLPSATVVASASAEAAEQVQRTLNSPTFRVYTNADVIGTELGGALKNVMAIGAAICDGMALGDNAKAAFVTRGLAEMVRLGVAAGAQATTFAGIAGFGDLIATCYSSLSRNYRVGLALAEGRTLEEAIESLGGQVAEGVGTTSAALEMAHSLGVDAPIAAATARVLFEGASPQDALLELMARAPRQE